MLDVTQKRTQEEDGCEDISPADDPCHRLHVDGVYGEERGGEEGGACWQESPGRGEDQAGGQDVQEDVGQVEAEGVEAGEPVVEAEREDAERAVRAVRVAGRQGCAPEVVLEDLEK